MPLPFIVEAEDQIPDGFEDHYQQSDKDQKYYLDVEDAVPRAEIKTLEKTLNELKGEKKKLSKKASEWDRITKELGEDYNVEELLEIRKSLPDNFTVEQLIDAVENIGGGDDDDDKSKRKGDNQLAERIRDREKKKYQREIDSRESKIDRYRSNLERVLIDNELNQALVEANVPKHMLKAARLVIKADHGTELQEDGEGQFSGIIKATREPIKEFVKDWANTDEGKNYVSANVNSGGGTPPGGGERGNGTTKNPFSKKNWNMTEQVKLYKTDRKKYDQLKAQAEAG